MHAYRSRSSVSGARRVPELARSPEAATSSTATVRRSRLVRFVTGRAARLVTDRRVALGVPLDAIGIGLPGSPRRMKHRRRSRRHPGLWRVATSSTASRSISQRTCRASPRTSRPPRRGRSRRRPPAPRPGRAPTRPRRSAPGRASGPVPPEPRGPVAERCDGEHADRPLAGHIRRHERHALDTGALDWLAVSRSASARHPRRRSAAARARQRRYRTGRPRAGAGLPAPSRSRGRSAPCRGRAPALAPRRPGRAPRADRRSFADGSDERAPDRGGVAGTRERPGQLGYGLQVTLGDGFLDPQESSHRAPTAASFGRPDARYHGAVVKRVLLASPRGYCAGVERAVDTVERALELTARPSTSASRSSTTSTSCATSRPAARSSSRTRARFPSARRSSSRPTASRRPSTRTRPREASARSTRRARS